MVPVHIDVVTKDMKTGDVYKESVRLNENTPPTFQPRPSATNSVIGSDDRYDGGEMPYICYIETTFPSGGTNQGTGFVVGNNVVITAGHIIYKSEYGGYATSVNIYPQRLYGDLPFGTYHADKLHVTNNYAYSIEDDAHRKWAEYYDIGIIETSGNIGANTGTLGLTYFRNENTLLNEDFSLTSYDIVNGIYPASADGNIHYVEMYHNVDGADYYKCFHDLDTKPTASGSPIYDGDGIVHAVHVGGVREDETHGLNVGVVITKLYYDWIYGYVNG